MGVSEKVLVQMGKQHLNTWVTLYLEDEYGGIVSEQRTVRCHHEKEIKEAELMVGVNSSAHIHPQDGVLDPC